VQRRGLVAPQGFEPRYAAPEAAVLPLLHVPALLSACLSCPLFSVTYAPCHITYFLHRRTRSQHEVQTLPLLSHQVDRLRFQRPKSWLLCLRHVMADCQIGKGLLPAAVRGGRLCLITVRSRSVTLAPTMAALAESVANPEIELPCANCSWRAAGNKPNNSDSKTAKPRLRHIWQFSQIF
jgi:hypothetical protein